MREVQTKAERLACHVARVEEEDDPGEVGEDETKFHRLLPQREAAERTNTAVGWFGNGTVDVRGDEEAQSAVRTDFSEIVTAVGRRAARVEAAKEENLLIAHDRRIGGGRVGRIREGIAVAASRRMTVAELRKEQTEFPAKRERRRRAELRVESYFGLEAEIVC